MRPLSVDDDELTDALATVIARFGVDGASISRLSAASGLQRASLYHRFPGGKTEIVARVVDRTIELLDEALAPAHSEGNPGARARAVAAALASYHDDGARSSLLVALSVGDEEGRAGGASCLDRWVAAFERIARDAGRDPEEARGAAVDAVAAIEGALAISSLTSDRDPFARAIAALPARLTEPTS